MVVLVLGGSGRDFDERRFGRLNGAQEPLDAFDFAHPPMAGLDRSVAEVFLHAEHVDPALRKWEPDGHVLARDLAVLAADVARNEHVAEELHLLASHAELRPHLERQLSVLWRADAEAEQLNVTRVRRLELDGPGLFEFRLIDAAVELNVFQSDPFFRDDGDDVVPADHFFALPRQVVDAELHVGQAREERQKEDAHPGDLPHHSAHFVLFDVELVDGRHLHFVRLVRNLRLLPRRGQQEKGLFNRHAELFELVVAVGAEFEKLGNLCG